MTYHSPLGASGASRWMACPGSVALRVALEPSEKSEDEPPAYTTDGTTAHAGAAWCLENDADTWEIIGQTFEGHEFTLDMAKAVQVYLDAVRDDIRPTSLAVFEKWVSDDLLHADFGGTTDCGVVNDSLLTVSDYKNGVGVVVEIRRNPQIMYYAYGLIRKLNDPAITTVRLRVVQPNAFHPQGPVREWNCTVEELTEWAELELLPAMRRTEVDQSLEPGSHCRFCPARIVCPAMSGMWGAFAGASAGDAPALSDAELGRQYQLTEAVMIYKKALGDEVYRRLLHGKEVPFVQLEEKTADRAWKDGAEDRFKAEYGDKAYSNPKLLSPAQMEKVDPAAKPLVKEWAYQPKSGYTVGLIGKTKKRPVQVRTATEVFKAALEELLQENDNV